MGSGGSFLRSKFFAFLVVGALTACLYFGLLFLGLELLRLNYLASVTIAYTVSVGFQFFSNRGITFRASAGNVVHQSTRYLGLILLNYLITLTVVFVSVDKLGLSAYTGVAISIACTVVIGYKVSKHWVFRHGKCDCG